MQFYYLVEFVSIAKAKSFSNAALELNTSESTLSRHMKSLEASLGLKLIERRPHGIELTEDGRNVFERASDISEILDGIDRYSKSKVKQHRAALYGIAGFPCIVKMIYAAMAGSGMDDGPCPLTIVPTEALRASDIQTAFQTADLTLFVTYSSDKRLESLDDTFKVTVFFHKRIVALMDPKHPLASRELLHAADLQNQIFIHAESDYLNAYNDWVDTKTILDEHGIRYQSITGVFEQESDWYRDYANRIMLLPEESRGVDQVRNFGITGIPIDDLYHTYVAVSKKGDSLADKVLGIALD